MILSGELVEAIFWCAVAAILIAIIQYWLVNHLCMREQKTEPSTHVEDHNNPYEQRSWLLFGARALWTIGLLASPQNLLFLLAHFLRGTYPRDALEIGNEFRALKREQYPLKLRNLPPIGSPEEQGAICLRDIWFFVEFCGPLIVLVCEQYWPWLAVLLIWLLVCRAAILVYSILQKGPRHGVWSFQRTGAVVMVNYLCLIVQFGYLYWFVGHDVTQFDPAGPCPNESWSTALYFSVVTITTLGYGDIAPVGGVARAVVGCETLVGVLYIVGVVQMLISSWPRR